MMYAYFIHYLFVALMSFLSYYKPRSKERLLRGERVHWIENNSRRSYIRQCVLSFPNWVDSKELKALQAKCKEIEQVTGIRHTLDHYIPLNHPRVCGLSVPWNLRIIPKASNESKGNGWCEWHGDLFDAPEQLRLV